MTNDKLVQTVNTLFKGMEGYLTTKSVVGEPIKVNDTIILPLMDVQFGVGAGAFSSEKSDKGGGGMSGKLSPSAIIVIKDGEANLLPLQQGSGAGLSKYIDMIPELIKKYVTKSDTDEDITDEVMEQVKEQEVQE